jgi:hypothetical protein
MLNPVARNERVCRSVGIHPHNLNLGRDDWSTSRPGCFTHGKGPWYQFNGRLGGPPEPV